METKRISVNKLAEYMKSTSALRRKTIIKDAKNPEAFKVTRYTETREALKNYFENGGNDQYIFDALIQLETKESNTIFQISDKNTSIEALQIFIESPSFIQEGFDYKKNSNNQLIEISGVQISVNPDLLIYENDSIVGALKLHIAKGSLEEDSQKTVAVMLRKYLETIYEVEPNRKLCVSLDVFSRSLVNSPEAYRRVMSSVEACCEEIAARWDSV